MAYVLIGFMGAGKSTALVELGSVLGQGTFDSDALLAERFGHSVAREFELHGEQAFRAAEEQLVCELLDGARPDDVVALGGGSVLSEQVREKLRGEVVVLLDIDADTAWERVAGPDRGEGRPLAGDRDAFRRLHGERAAVYEQLATAVIPSMAPGRIADVAPSLRTLHNSGLPAGTRLSWASAASGSYPVFIGRGLVGEAGVGRGLWPPELGRSRPFIVSDSEVADLYGSRFDGVGTLAGRFEIAPGEQSKTLAGAEAVWGAMVEAGVTRADHVVALGGGVVGDLAGFCAATYQRGIPVVHVPTTLVAQVDSAYGGKTGVDLPAAKNYIGAYHQPAAVIVDPDLLATLPAQELAAGWVEVLKTALIAGGTLWESVGRGDDPDEQAILACVRTKLAVVAADERDGGRRQVLNLGHTVGHAIETVTGYARYRHGEAVGLGLLAALRLSGRDDLRMQVHDLLRARGLPVRAEGLDAEELLAAIGRDKKRLGESVPFVLVDAPGDVRYGCEVGQDEVRAAVAELVA
jgi:shikimate kinase / 3-dehydroquinate synthase